MDKESIMITGILQQQNIIRPSYTRHYDIFASTTYTTITTDIRTNKTKKTKTENSQGSLTQIKSITNVSSVDLSASEDIVVAHRATVFQLLQWLIPSPE